MARFQAVPEFIQKNVELLDSRTATQYAKYLEQKPTFVTYYHVNKVLSTTDKGLKNAEAIVGVRSPIKYNKILQFPIYGIESIVLALEDTEMGLDTDYDGEGVILPNTIHPVGDDYFTIDYLDKKYTFRVVRYDYDTIKSNSYYKIEFTIRGVDIDIQEQLEKQVVKTYRCRYENIGTNDKVLIDDETYAFLSLLETVMGKLRKSYLEMFYVKKYNTPLFYLDNYCILYDPNLCYFCNHNDIFNEQGSIDTTFFYEEKRDYFEYSYSKSIYDRLEHVDVDDFFSVDRYYDMDPAVASDSIFMYWADRRIKYLAYYSSPQSVYDYHIPRYIDDPFIDAMVKKDETILRDNLSILVYRFLNKLGANSIVDIARTMIQYHYRYTFHNFIFMPMAIYCLKQVYNQLASTEAKPYDTDTMVTYGPENV